MRTVLRRLLYLLRQSRHEADLREEIETHRAMRAAAFERKGVAPLEAARLSRRALGNVPLAVEDARDVWIVRAADTVRQDVSAALRGLRKSPGFTLVAVATLALGIGANTALFSIFNSLLLRPLPVREPERLVLLDQGSWTYPIWEEIRRFEPTIFDGAFAWASERFDLSRGGRTILVDGAYVSGRAFEVLGIQAWRGRTIGPADDTPGAEGPVAVISHRFWLQHFDGDDDVVGRPLTVQRLPLTIVGVMPPAFFGPTVGQRADVMLPFAAEPLIRGRESSLGARSNWWVEIMARLKPGQGLDEATAALRALQPSIRLATMPDYPEALQPRYLKEAFTLVPASTGRSPLRTRFEAPLRAMVVAVGLVLLVACANIASLMLARALARRKELSVRLALGASRWRVGRLLFTESVLVALAGSAAGVVFARWGADLLVQQLSTWRAAVALDLALDWRVLGFTASLTCLAALIAGVAPVLGVRRVAANDALKEAGRGVAGEGRLSARGLLVAAQIALSLVLVVAAGLFLRTFTSLRGVPLGFESDRLVVADVDLQATAPAAEDRMRLVDRLRDAAVAIPGVTSTGISRITPLSGAGWNSWVGDSPAPPADRSHMTWLNAVSPGWFSTMGMRLLAGRDLEEGDRLPQVRVAVVNETFARRFLSGPPVGQSVELGGRDRFEVVGLVSDAIYRHPREGAAPTMYLPPAADQGWRQLALTVAASPGSRMAVERELGAALTRVHPALAYNFRTFDQLADATVTQERLVAMLSSFFGGLALLIAGIGLYGLVSNAVRARQTEIGVRMALGADPSGITRLVFARVTLLLAAGLAIGLAGAFWATRFVDGLLFELHPRDPAVFAGAAAVLVLVGLLAAWLPARRAAALDPASVLREG